MSTALNNSLPALLSNLTTSIESATEISPKETSVLSSKDGISLLDTKNELFLSYIQNLVFLILLKIRHASIGQESSEEANQISKLNDEVVKKLTELRVYLEKGVKPVEDRLKYQIDKVVKAAEEALQSQNAKKSTTNSKTNGTTNGSYAESDASNEPSEDASDSNSSVDMNELSFRPNPAALMKPKNANDDDLDTNNTNDGIYRPPRINPTALPTTEDKEKRAGRRPHKSAAIDEFISNELSTAPMAEPSIGSSIRSGGRHTLTQRERERDAERAAYEEANFVRLPKESKKDRAQRRGRQGAAGGFGGEEWRNLGAGLDRIERLTKKSAGTAGQLARSRKRAVDDGPRDSGVQFGSQFAKRQKRISKP